MQRNTCYTLPLYFVKSENPSSKMRAENFKGPQGSLRITRTIRVYIYFLARYYSRHETFFPMVATFFHPEGREIFEKC